MNVIEHQLRADLLRNAIGMQGFDRLVHLCHFAMESTALPGVVVEFGCHEGKTAALLGAVTGKEVWVYDSFEGLPQPQPFEEEANINCRLGALKVEPEKAAARFRRNHLPFRLKKNFFKDLAPQDMPLEVAFCHIDADLASSTVEALKLVYESLVPGAYCFIDDYGDKVWCGAGFGAAQFMADKVELLTVPKGLHGEHPHHCYFVKQ